MKWGAASSSKKDPSPRAAAGQGSFKNIRAACPSFMLGSPPMPKKTPKHIGFLPSREEEEYIERAAGLKHWNKSQFARLAAVDYAHRVIAEEAKKVPRG